MAFAFTRSQSDEKTDKKNKRSPLAGWLGRKAEPEEELPQMDVAAGLNRALKSTGGSTPSKQEPNDDPLREALASIEAALYSIDRIREIIEETYEVVLSAKDVEDVGGRALLAESYDELRLSINTAVDTVDERAALLIGRSQRHIDVHLGGKAHYAISPTRLDVSSKGLALDPPREAFATFEEIMTVLDELDTALQKADRAAAGYCRDAQFLMGRMSSEAA